MAVITHINKIMKFSRQVQIWAEDLLKMLFLSITVYLSLYSMKTLRQNVHYRSI